MEKTNLKLIAISEFVVILILIGSILFMALYSDIGNSENNLYKTILRADAKVSDASLLSDKALNYYDQAGISYERQDYRNVESSCKLARSSFSDASQGYLEVASELKRSNLEDPLVDNYVERLGLLSEIQLNLYEACEHFESAARYYNIYYNTDVPYYDQSYDMGTGEIDAMNEKINLHDANVRKHNEILADYTIELENRLK